jgi:hypothetical protein
LELAQAAVRVFEEAVQLEMMPAASMSPDLNILRRMALVTANAALENVEVSLAAIDDLDFVGNRKALAATIQARLKRGCQQFESKLQATGSRYAANRTLAGEDR